MMPAVDRVAVVGAGVIGSAWAARFALHGVDVAVHDPDPGAAGVVENVLADARAAWADLGLPTPTEGRVDLVDSLAEAVDGAGLVQESTPENPELKRSVLAAIDAEVPIDVVIASSTSGIRPSELQSGLAHPARMVVGHPFNPVYLLPLVEVCGGELTVPATIERVMEIYASVSMKPLHVRVEVDAFIADRLLEAVWREALWLVHDGVATTGEIDDAIRYGFGLRWAQMGLFETYRTAGGDGGFGHFIAQFAPTLAWPWTKLTDVPDLDDELVARLVAQSDAQSGEHTIPELRRIRDRNLAAILLALEEREWGAGVALAAQRAALSPGDST